MHLPTLDTLLLQIKEGDTSEALLVRAQTLLSTDERLPEELRNESLRDDPIATAVALLGVLGHDDGFGLDLAAALAFELTELDRSTGPIIEAQNRPSNESSDVITADMVEALESDGLPIAPAVVAEAGDCDVAIKVMRQLGIDRALPLAAAIEALAGPVDVASHVMLELGHVPVPVAEAVRAEAGSIDIISDVMSRVRRTAVVPAAVIETPKPVNQSWMSWSFVAIAAAMMLAVFSLQMLRGNGIQEIDNPGFQFASASEIVVDDLVYDEEAFVQVIQDTDDQGEQALIIWVDDEAVL